MRYFLKKKNELKTRSFYFLAFCFLLLFAVSVKAEIGLHFESTTLEDFVKFVMHYADINIVYDPKDLQEVISIKTKKKFNKKEIINIMYTLLRINNLEAVRENNIIYIVNKFNVAKMPFSYKADQEKREEGIEANKLAISIFQIKNVDVKNLLKFLNIIKSDAGIVITIPKVNAIVVKDRSDNIERMSDIIESVSAMKTGFKIETILLKNTKAEEFVRTINRFFVEISKTRYLGVKPVFMADAASNSVIIAALPEDIKIIRQIVSDTDVIKDTATSPKVFKLKYAMAKDVEEVLNKILTSTQKDKVEKSPKEKLMKVAANKATNTISVIGPPELYAQVKAIIEKLDIPRDQIFVETLIIETTLEKGSKFGVEWLAGGGKENLVGTGGFIGPGNVIDLQSPVLEGEPPNFQAIPGGFTLGILGNIITYEGVKFPTLSALVNAIKEETGVNILSKPQLLTLDNEEAEVFVGENRPFKVSEKFDANNNPIQTFDYRDVGIKLKILPHVIDNETVLLNISQEVKKVLTTASLDETAPVTLTRSTKTTVKLNNNMTVVISGLIKDDTGKKESRVPFLSSIPILGWLFHIKETTREKTNLMVFINANIIKGRQDIEKLTKSKQETIEKEIKKDKEEKNSDEEEINILDEDIEIWR